MQKRCEALGAAIDCFRIAVIVLYPFPHIDHVNPAAEKLLASSSPLRSDDEDLSFRNVNEHSRFRIVASRVLKTHVPAALRAGGMSDALELVLVPVGESTSALIVFANPRFTTLTASNELLADLYELTHSEIGIVRKIVEGRSVSGIAGELSLSEHTVRTHLHRIFDKTRTCGQADLIRLMLGGVAAVSCTSGAAAGKRVHRKRDR